jgi:hypothetical protein
MKTTDNTWQAGGWGVHWQDTDKLNFWVDDYLTNFALTGALSTATTYNFVGTYDNATLRTYIDGVPAGTDTVVAPDMGTGNVFIGAYALGNKFDGRLDEVFYIPTDLTAAQVLALHNASQ